MRKRPRLLACLILAIVVGGGYGSFLFWRDDISFHAGKRLYYRSHDYPAALAKYRQVGKSSPHYRTAQRYIGHNIYGREWGRWQEGIPYLEEAYRVAPDDPKVLEDIGRAYIKVGRIQEGTERLREAKTDVARAALEELRDRG